MEWYAASGLRKQFRADAGFARPEIYEYLEEHDFLYAIRLPAKAVLEREITAYLERPGELEPGTPVVPTTPSSTRRLCGTGLVGWLPRSNGMLPSCSPELPSS